MRTIMPFRYGRIEKDDVNQLAVENYFKLIDRAEEFYKEQITAVVKDMEGPGEEQVDIICLSGPSASGKTTTAHTLRGLFQRHGRNARVVSLDDFYLDAKNTPLNKWGQPDYENIYSLDVSLINTCIEQLVKEHHTRTPIFDFQKKQRCEKWNDITVSGSDVVIIEGIHGLNPLLTEVVGENNVTKIYVSARSKFVDKDREIFSPKDIRLMRRMVRDVTERSTPPEQTIEMWDFVCDGERDYINPHRDSAKYKIDTTLDYEPNIFHKFLLPFLDRPHIRPDSYRRLDDLYQRLDEFFDINDLSVIPSDSVIREFIGPKK